MMLPSLPGRRRSFFAASWRRLRSAPPDWRLWGLAIIVAVLSQVSTLALPLLSVINLIGILYYVNPYATRYVLHDRTAQVRIRDQWFVFLGSMLVAGLQCFVIVRFVDLWIGDNPYRLPMLVMPLALLGVWLVWLVFRMGWRWPFVFVTFVVIFVSALFALWDALTELQAEGRFHGWVRTALRLTLVFAAHRFFTSSARYRIGNRSWQRRMQRQAIASACFVALVSLIFEPPGTVMQAEGPNRILWILLAVGLAAVSSVQAWNAQVSVVRDRQWLERLRRDGVALPWAENVGAILALASLPALALMQVAPWQEWLAVFSTTLVAMALHAASCTVRPRRQRGTGSRAGRPEHVDAAVETP